MSALDNDELIDRVIDALKITRECDSPKYELTAKEIIALVTAHNHKAAIEAVENERLVEPTNEADDVSYECAISHAQHAIDTALQVKP